MEKVHIKNGDPDNLTKNLSMQEVWNSTNPRQEWDCPVALINAFQILRDWINDKLICSSTYRNPDAYGRGSAHEAGLAIDCYSKVVDIVSIYNFELTDYLAGNGSALIEKLREAGIDGFGREKNCIHIETGGYGVQHKRKLHTDKWGTFTAFIWTGFGKNDINKSI